MIDDIYDKDSKPNDDSRIAGVITNLFNTYDRKIDTDIYFYEMFSYLHEMFLENMKASLSKSFMNDNIYNFASFSEEKKMTMLQNIFGTSFEVEYQDGIIIRVVSCGEFFKSLLRKSCEDINLAYVIEKNVGYHDEISYVFKFVEEIDSPDAYLEFMNASAEIKRFDKIMTAKNIDKLIQLCKVDTSKFTFNLKNLMQQAYNKTMLKEARNDDLTSYIKKIYESVV